MRTLKFPYYIERSTNVKKSEVLPLISDELYTMAAQYQDLLKRMSDDSAIKLLEKDFSVSNNNALLNIKRMIFNNKRINSIDESINGESLRVIEEYRSLVNMIQFAENELEEKYVQVLEQNRKQLKNFFISHDEILKVLPLININFDAKLKQYISIPVEQHNAKIRKLDHQLIRLYTRNTMKTSPFSFFCPVCLSSFNSINDNSEDRLLNLSEINNYLVKSVYDNLMNIEYFAKQIDYRFVAYLESEEGYLFIGQRDYEKGKVYKTVDFTIKISKNIAVKALIDKFKNNSFKFNEGVSLLKFMGMKEDKAEELLLNGLIKNGMLTPDLSVDETDNIFENVYNKLSLLKDNAEGLLEYIIRSLEKLETLNARFSVGTWNERFEILQKVDSNVSEIFDVLKVKVNHDILMYEDVIYSKPKKPLKIDETDIKNLSDLLRYCKIFDQSIITFLWFGEKFQKRYGDKKIRANDLDVYWLYVKTASELVNLWKDNFTELNINTINKINRISSMKKRFKEFVSTSDKSKTLEIEGFIHNEVMENKEIINGDDIDSATFYIQLSDSKDIIVNKIYKGQLTFFSRFLKLYNSDRLKEVVNEYIKQAFEENPCEVTEAFGFNANAHHRIMPSRLYLNLTDRNDISTDDININDCYFFFDQGTKKVKLWNEKLGIVNPYFLGSLAVNLMPVELRTLDSMQPSTRFDMSYLNLWDFKRTDSLIIDILPTIKYKNIILVRKQYLINCSYDMNLPKKELYLKIVKDFKDSGIPLRFFARPYINSEGFDFFNMGRTSLKPQFIDLRSPMLFQELLSWMSTHKEMIIEEVMPDNNDDYINEYQIEISINHKLD